MNHHLKQTAVVFFLIYLACFHVHASPFKDKDIDFFPIPVFETRPDEGQTYGAMPVLLFSDKDTGALQTITAAMVQWNEVIKWSGTVVAFYYPDPNHNPEEVFEFYFEWGQHYFRETTIRYTNPHLGERFYLDSLFLWLKTPFGRFYGYGANSQEANESNFVTNTVTFDTTFGYYFFDKKLRASFTETIAYADLQTGAFTDVNDTLTSFAGTSGVVNSTHFIHKLSLTYDTRDGKLAKKGSLAEISYRFSHKNLGSDQSFHGFSLEGLHMRPWWQDRTVTVLRLYLEDLYGTNLPFYHRPSLGGAYELRSFIPNRFRDFSKFVLTWEQRFQVLEHSFFGVPVKLSLDPFLEVGRVFNHFDDFAFKDLQVVGGLGIRGIVPPNVVARIDVAIGSEGYNVYTLLNYPF